MRRVLIRLKVPAFMSGYEFVTNPVNGLEVNRARRISLKLLAES
jgi:hypothetical protein